MRFNKSVICLMLLFCTAVLALPRCSEAAEKK